MRNGMGAAGEGAQSIRESILLDALVPSTALLSAAAGHYKIRRRYAIGLFRLYDRQ
jgi:hypothetical protein